MKFPKYLPEKFYSLENHSTMFNREEIDDKYKWDTAEIYNSQSEWEKDFKWVIDQIPLYKNFMGKLNESSEIFLSCLKFHDEIGIKLDRLSLYAMLLKDIDMSNQNSLAIYDRIQTLYSNASSMSSFINPEILQIPDDKLQKMISFQKQLEVYNHYLDNLKRLKPHTLSKEEERVLALAEDITTTPYDVFSIFTNVDFKFQIITDDKGNLVELSHAGYYAAMHSKDREYRKKAFSTYLKSYQQNINTLAVLFTGNLKSKIFTAKAREYRSSREASLNRGNIPLSVYDNLVENTANNVAPLRRWAKLKKEILGVTDLHSYDLYVDLFNYHDERKYNYDEAAQIVRSALEPLGEKYRNVLDEAFNNRWIDVYETQAKRSGAYSSGTTFGVHPYILLNWTNLLNDVFTLAHELGHNMHSYLTEQNQPYPYANYSIFLAEVASTCNESLLLNYLIKNAKSDTEKMHLLEIYLNNITSTFYRQVIFAEFEKITYEKLESGTALTAEVLRKMYREISEKYWEDEIVIDEADECTWARIPHFYYNFYVFQYATGFAASEILSQKILADGKDAVERYLNFLKAGDSDYPINILIKAGVDMNSPEPVLAVTKKMDLLLDELEALVLKKALMDKTKLSLKKE